MRRAITLALLAIGMFTQVSSAQYATSLPTNGSVLNAKKIVVSPPLKQITEPLNQEIIRKRKPGYHQKGDWILHDVVNPLALPLSGNDPALQTKYAPPLLAESKSLQNNFDGIANTGVDPADPCIAVGPNHVVQMINAASGARIKIWDKSGNELLSGLQFDAISGVSGKGDPIVLYDHLEDRWLLSEFSVTGNKLVVGISKSADPMGAYDIYSFTAPEFPDYPKYAIWPDAYIITTNESSQKVYAIDREAMLSGTEHITIQEFALPSFPTIGFQAATPVSIEGNRMPAQSHAPGMIMRMADDAWGSTIATDRLEIYELNLDWADPTASYISTPIMLPTEPFDTELCGYTGFSCVQQPDDAVALDPLRELLMYKISYRNFGDYEAIICNHVVDADGSDHAGIRWYELRNFGSGWQIYQQGTYAPDDDHRWMGSIGFNDDGSIALAYNVSGPNTYPSIRYTGRNNCDPLGQMTLGESNIIAGESSNSSNRYGDYNVIATDPSDGSFWFTAMYNDATDWQTRVAQFEVPSSCSEFMINTLTPELNICAGDMVTLDLDLKYFGTFAETVSLSSFALPTDLTLSFPNGNSVSTGGQVTVELSSMSSLADGVYGFSIVADAPSMTRNLDIRVSVYNSNIANAPMLLSPANSATGVNDQPVFIWTTDNNAEHYQIEISDDPTFAISVEESIINNRNHYRLASILSTGTSYYWRVIATNSCGAQVTSAINSFSTNSCDIYSATAVPLDISESGQPTITSTLTIAESGVITDVNLSNLDIEHTWINDLTVILTSPSGTSVEILKNICNSEDNISIAMDDAAIAHGNMPCPPISTERYQPMSPFSVFNGEEMQGDWVLTISDRSNLDGGQLLDWGLELCSSTAVSCVLIDAQVVTHCDDMSTSDIADDRFSFDLNLTGTGLSDSVDIVINGIAFTYAYANAIHIDNVGVGFLISDGDVVINIADQASAICSLSYSVTAPTACSVPLSPCGDIDYVFDGVLHDDNTLTTIEYRAAQSTTLMNSQISVNQDLLFTAGDYILIDMGTEITPNSPTAAVSFEIGNCE